MKKISSTKSEFDAVETAIATLRCDLPTLFVRDIDYSIYSGNIFFKDPVNTFQYKFNYRIIFWTLRFHARLFFTEIHFDVHDIRRDTENMIKVDWTVRGTLRLPWRADLWFGGNSTYTLDERGKIYRHVDTWNRSPREILQQFWPRSGAN
ncbi:uncharacterized conserved protein (DUF2358) [Rubidibacter lacunae KORDI 51-2]|uniref:Uncharacterized conserved protein (DUF2358) n=1 Tax=Rubidibacter lacunae KORDI 51-2 TaxID=582515 RepID=U5DQM7_9CHRO|nr:DUF2358 domain-containing protein [Rubidibacter lacunae]ERN41990.1 uncharacterized conserved protein (DUF2358) [Rubidibacter lacunae KORDI 51-2]